MLAGMRFSKIGFNSHGDPGTMKILDVEGLGWSAGNGIPNKLLDATAVQQPWLYTGIKTGI